MPAPASAFLSKSVATSPKPDNLQKEQHSDFFAGINKIVNYFARTSKGGFLFCSHDKTLVVQHIVRTVMERATQKKLNIKELYLNAEDADSFLSEIRALATEKPDGIIISNLDELIVLTKDRIIDNINLSRDILLSLDVPFLFCLTQENISKFANQASDLYLRRDRSVIFFPDPPEETGMDKLKDFHTVEYRESVDFKSLKLKIGLLEKQLKEAEEKKYKPERIANEITLDLIVAYYKAGLLKNADQLFHRYKAYFNLEDHLKTIDIAAILSHSRNRLDEALEYYFKSKALNEASRNEEGIAGALYSIGAVHLSKNDSEEGLKYLFESKKN